MRAFTILLLCGVSRLNCWDRKCIKMKILVIGGTYFLGKHFVEMASKSHEVTILHRGNKKKTNENVKQIIADRHTVTKENFQSQTFDVVVDFCAYQKGDIKQVVQALDGNIEQYIFISTCDVYERGTNKIIDENFQLENRNLDGEAGAYIAGKVALEAEILELSKQYGMNYTSIRPAFIYGPYNYAPREEIFFRWIKDAGQILLPKDATGSFQMVFVGDVAQVIMKACGNEDTYNKSFNICGDEIINYEIFGECLKEATGENFNEVKISVEEITQRNIPLPFPLTKEESEQYKSENIGLLNVEFIELKEGLKMTYEQFESDEMIAEIDGLFDENKPKEAEKFMLLQLEKALIKDKRGDMLKLYNELIGYYRQTSEKEKLYDVVIKALELGSKMEITDTIEYATTAINAANAYRSTGDLEESKKYYGIAESIYNEKIAKNLLDVNDMLVAGLYNNISLMYQELGDFDCAREYLFKALSIVTYNKAEFEIAVTHANIANTFLLVKDYERAMDYANRATRLFKAAGIIDPHYCAALSALGNCYFEQGDIVRAKSIFEKALNIIEETFGHNSQYERLKESVDRCADKITESPTNGMELSEKYYQKYGIPMIEEKFKDYEDKIAVGLVGEGSDCFGYDDELSFDHDSGPDFCMWVTKETYEKIGKQLEEEYKKIPKEFMGRERNTTAMGNGRRGVLVISDFYEKYVGDSEADNIDYSQVEDYSIACAVNGKVFRDDEGIFTKIRNRILLGYPKKIRLLKLAEDVANFTQYGLYNYKRMKQRGDDLAATILISDCCKYAMKMYHHIYNVFPPHNKWLHKSTLDIPDGNRVIYYIEAAINKDANGEDAGIVEKVLDDLGLFLAKKMYEKDDISDIDFYLDHHVSELVFKAGISEDSKEELVDRIARLEFQAFDKVQNEGGRASCQNDWPTFYVMRKSQYMTWNMTMLKQYLYDFTREFEKGHNLITEKYGRMMESTDPKHYEEIKENFPELTEEKKAVIEQIVAIQMDMVERFAKEHPKVAGNARNLHTYEDEMFDTSYETYLRGEISTYSDKMLQLYGAFVVATVNEGENLAYRTIENTAKIYGFENIEEFESRAE